MVRDALKDLGFTDYGTPITPLYSDTYAYALEMRSTTADRKIKLFIQGSYANNTNVRTQSDVDIAVVQEDIFRTEYRTSTIYPQSDSDYGFTPVSSSAQIFKDEVQQCLTRKFGRDVERKNKSIKVHGNTYRKDADTVPSSYDFVWSVLLPRHTHIFHHSLRCSRRTKRPAHTKPTPN